jgi:peptidoglycan/LPS O-acetylase OafA/YrhL
MSPKQQFLALDLVRGLAAIEVMLFHVRGTAFELSKFPPSQKLIGILFFGPMYFGREAVFLFFLLSGFLVGGQIIRNLERGCFDLQRYAIDRCVRIFLPLFPACILTAGVSIYLGTPFTGWQLIGNAIGLNGVLVDTMPNNPPLWSLAYEIWFYITGGTVGWLMASRRPVALLSVILSVSVFSTLNASYLLLWIIGATLVFLPGTSVKDVESTLIGKPAKALAAFSYTLYLTHWPVNRVLSEAFPTYQELTLASIGCFVARLLVCLISAWAMYLLFERHTETIKNRVRRLIASTNYRHLTSLPLDENQPQRSTASAAARSL